MYVCTFIISGKKCDDPNSPDYVPTIFDFTSSPEKKRALAKVDRYNQRQQRGQRIEDQNKRQEAAKVLLDLSQNTTESPGDKDNDIQTDNPLNSVFSQSDLSASDIVNLEKECQQLRQDCAFYKSVNYAATFREESFKSNDEKVKYCTGLPSYAVMMVLFTRIYQFLRETHSGTKFQQFIITLLRLCMDMP